MCKSPPDHRCYLFLPMLKDPRLCTSSVWDSIIPARQDGFFLYSASSETKSHSVLLKLSWSLFISVQTISIFTHWNRTFTLSLGQPGDKGKASENDTSPMPVDDQMLSMSDSTNPWGILQSRDCGLDHSTHQQLEPIPEEEGGPL